MHSLIQALIQKNNSNSIQAILSVILRNLFSEGFLIKGIIISKVQKVFAENTQ